MANYGPWLAEQSPKWKRMAEEAIEQSRRILDAIPPQDKDIGDPNHPAHSGLFGYDVATFMSKQYQAD